MMNLYFKCLMTKKKKKSIKDKKLLLNNWKINLSCNLKTWKIMLIQMKENLKKQKIIWKKNLKNKLKRLICWIWKKMIFKKYKIEIYFI